MCVAMFAATALVSSAAAAAIRNGVIAYSPPTDEGEPPSVMKIRPDGTGDALLLGPTARLPRGATAPVWSTDGRRLLFLSSGVLWRANADGERIRRIRLHLGRVFLYGFDWSPSGRRVVFAARGGDPSVQRPMIYTIRVNGRRRRALHRGFDPSWSGDGRHIVFTSVRSFGSYQSEDRAQISIMRSNGTRVRALTGGLHDDNPAFSPDGRRVAFVRNSAALQGEEWRIIDVDGHNDTLVRSLDGTSHVRYCPPRWTPDGRALAAIRTTDGPTDNDPSTADFVMIEPSGTNERVLFRFPLMYVARYSMCHFSWRPLVEQ
jgi:Tol biopolymer transport system component